MKEKLPYLALDFDTETQETPESPDREKTDDLPDGNIMDRLFDALREMAFEKERWVEVKALQAQVALSEEDFELALSCWVDLKLMECQKCVRFCASMTLQYEVG